MKRNWNGTTIQLNQGLTIAEQEIVSHAINTFGFLVPLNTEVSKQDFIERIERYCSPSPRIEVICKTLNKAMV